MNMAGKWGVLFRSETKREGYKQHLCWDWKDPDRTTVKLFRTRREARQWAKERYGYISRRPDLRKEPHGLKPPKVVKVKVWYEIQDC